MTRRTLVVRPCCDTFTAAMIRPSSSCRLTLQQQQKASYHAVSIPTGYGSPANAPSMLEVRTEAKVVGVWPRGDAQWQRAASSSSSVEAAHHSSSSLVIHVTTIAASPHHLVGTALVTAPASKLGEVLLLLWSWDGVLVHVVRGVGLVARPSSDAVWLSSVLPTDEFGSVFVMSTQGGLSYVALHSGDVIEHVLPPRLNGTLPQCITAAYGEHEVLPGDGGHTRGQSSSCTVLAVADSGGRVLLLRNSRCAVLDLHKELQRRGGGPAGVEEEAAGGSTHDGAPPQKESEATALWIRIGTGTTMDIVSGGPCGSVTIVKIDTTLSTTSSMAMMTSLHRSPPTATRSVRMGGWGFGAPQELKLISKVVQRGVHQRAIDSLRFTVSPFIDDGADQRGIEGGGLLPLGLLVSCSSDAVAVWQCVPTVPGSSGFVHLSSHIVAPSSSQHVPLLAATAFVTVDGWTIATLCRDGSVRQFSVGNARPIRCFHPSPHTAAVRGVEGHLCIRSHTLIVSERGNDTFHVGTVATAPMGLPPLTSSREVRSSSLLLQQPSALQQRPWPEEEKISLERTPEEQQQQQQSRNDDRAVRMQQPQSPLRSPPRPSSVLFAEGPDATRRLEPLPLAVSDVSSYAAPVNVSPSTAFTTTTAAVHLAPTTDVVSPSAVAAKSTPVPSAEITRKVSPNGTVLVELSPRRGNATTRTKSTSPPPAGASPSSPQPVKPQSTTASSPAARTIVGKKLGADAAKTSKNNNNNNKPHLGGIIVPVPRRVSPNRLLSPNKGGSPPSNNKKKGLSPTTTTKRTPSSASSPTPIMELVRRVLPNGQVVVERSPPRTRQASVELLRPWGNEKEEGATVAENRPPLPAVSTSPLTTRMRGSIDPNASYDLPTTISPPSRPPPSALTEEADLLATGAVEPYGEVLLWHRPELLDAVWDLSSDGLPRRALGALDEITSLLTQTFRSDGAHWAALASLPSSSSKWWAALRSIVVSSSAAALFPTVVRRCLLLQGPRSESHARHHQVTRQWLWELQAVLTTTMMKDRLSAPSLESRLVVPRSRTSSVVTLYGTRLGTLPESKKLPPLGTLIQFTSLMFFSRSLPPLPLQDGSTPTPLTLYVVQVARLDDDDHDHDEDSAILTGERCWSPLSLFAVGDSTLAVEAVMDEVERSTIIHRNYSRSGHRSSPAEGYFGDHMSFWLLTPVMRRWGEEGTSATQDEHYSSVRKRLSVVMDDHEWDVASPNRVWV